MDQPRIIALCQPIFDGLVNCQREAFADFDRFHPPGIREGMTAARPKWVHERTLIRLVEEFGRSGMTPQRVVTSDQLTYLFVEGTDFNVSIRNKKLRKGFLSCNHQSANQDSLRDEGCFCQWHMQTAHVILGYRVASGEPAIRDIWLTSERMSAQGQWYVDWRHRLWCADGNAPALPNCPDLPDFPQELPPPPTVRRRGQGDSGKEKTG